GGKGKVGLRAQVGSASPRIRGACKAEDVLRNLRRRQAALRYCYARGLTLNPTLAGALDLRMLIDAEGRVTSAAVSGDELGGGVDACVVRNLRRIRVPVPTDGGVSNVRQQMTFWMAGDREVRRGDRAL